MLKHLDINRFNLTSSNTDSACFAIAGYINDSNHQVFIFIIKDKAVYDKRINKCLIHKLIPFMMKRRSSDVVLKIW